ncbi:hypothetical protein G5C60_08535 [Streptomyces sp. HC44]|uniref:Uncharacterized protein n=1 Tax=Streptomyces scabichelini TaxID=2711217 RepID=A0A6G4V116_9ACTN|nr:hypothetical protein [Streptomyces scabichelini]NGO07699.1 hypothetical protein [Streptomyces scabichelini]
MGTKTDDEAGVDTGTEAQRDEEEVQLTKDDGTAEDQADEAYEDDEQADQDSGDSAGVATSGSAVGQGAAAVVSAGLGIVSLTGSWVGTVAQARDSLYGQLETAQNAGVGEQIKQVYGDSWNANALVAGFFALAALITGVVVLVRPAFGNPDRVQAPWVKSVAWAGVSLGVIGLLLAALKYSDVLLSLPSASG